MPGRVVLLLVARRRTSDSYAVSWTNCQLAALDRIDHRHAPGDGFLRPRAARLDVAPQARRVRDAELADELPGRVVRLALGNDRAHLGGEILDDQQRGAKARAADQRAVADHDRQGRS